MNDPPKLLLRLSPDFDTTRPLGYVVKRFGAQSQPGEVTPECLYFRKEATARGNAVLQRARALERSERVSENDFLVYPLYAGDLKTGGPVAVPPPLGEVFAAATDFGQTKPVAYLIGRLEDDALHERTVWLDLDAARCALGYCQKAGPSQRWVIYPLYAAPRFTEADLGPHCAGCPVAVEQKGQLCEDCLQAVQRLAERGRWLSLRSEMDYERETKSRGADGSEAAPGDHEQCVEQPGVPQNP